MAVETATYISQLDITKPAATDPKSEGDDHLRLVKSTIKATFPNFTAATLNATQAQLDKLVTSIAVNASTPDNSIVVDLGGSVAIGAAAPFYRLDVRGGGFGLTVGSGSDTPDSTKGVWVVKDAGATFNGFSAQYNADGGVSVLVGNKLSAWVERVRIDTNGNLIQQAPSSPPALTTNGQMVFNLTSNTNLRVSVRGSDGVTRTANIALT
jgi:hypothetical protein